MARLSSPECFEWRRRREIASAAAIQSLELTGDESRSIVLVDVVALIHIHPPHRDGWLASLGSSAASRYSLPDALRVEEFELCGAGNCHSAVVQDLAGEIVPDAARVSVLGAAHGRFDVVIVVWDLHAKATVFEHVVRSHLCCNAN